MYAVIQDGGHQYRVEPGMTLQVQRKDAEVGTKVTFGNVAAIGGDELKFGAPYLDGAAVEATVTRHLRAPKIVVSKFRRRKNYRRRQGHRQELTELRIENISG